VEEGSFVVEEEAGDFPYLGALVMGDGVILRVLVEVDDVVVEVDGVVVEVDGVVVEVDGVVEEFADDSSDAKSGTEVAVKDGEVVVEVLVTGVGGL
jgi:hypothetical protein